MIHKGKEENTITRKKVLATTMAALMAAPLTTCGGGIKETTAVDTVAAAAAKEKVEDTMAAESKGKTSVEAAKTGVAKETIGGGLIMTTNVEFPPYKYHDGDAVVGIDAEIARAITDELGMKLEIGDIAFDSIIPEIVSNKADTGLAGMTVTEDRMQSVDFSNVCARASQEITVIKGNEITSPDDLKGITVGTQLGAIGDIYVLDLEADGVAIECYNRSFETVQALSQGKTNAVIIDGKLAKTFVAETQGLKILDESFTDEEYAIAVKGDNIELLEKTNGVLKTLKDNRVPDETATKYIKVE